jgi:hypothetical protein
MSTLRLGVIDKDSKFSNKAFKAYLSAAHHKTRLPISGRLLDDDLNFNWEDRWITLERINTNEVVELTKFLESVGLLPNAVHDGFFGYSVQAAVRLFQEYVRTEDPDYNVDLKGQAYCHPDGIVGKGTKGHIKRWKASGRKVHWGGTSNAKAIKQGQKWRKRFIATKDHLVANPGLIQQARKRFTRKTDSLPISEWKFPKSEPLLFGIRRNAHVDDHKLIRKKKRRPTDDLFVLLINGLSFVFYGSTDPSVHLSRADAPYLIDGQHLYRFSWHKISESAKTYKALRPARNGVVVIRDQKKVHALTDENIKKGPQKKTAHDINIHWSGIGTSNFSAGCQVIAGNGYLNDLEEYVSCKYFAAGTYSTLGKQRTKGVRRTKAAYNMLADLLLVYGRGNGKEKRKDVRYTLFSAKDMIAAGAISSQKLAGLRTKF